TGRWSALNSIDAEAAPIQETLTGGDHMKSKTSSRISKLNLSSKKTESNGNGNGHSTTAEVAAPFSSANKDAMPQSIVGVLGNRAPARNEPSELNKTQLLTALLAFRKGDFSVRLPIDLEGVDGKIADAFNQVMEQSERMAGE